MSQTTIHLEVPDNLMQDAVQSAAREGKSLDQWVRSASEERVRLERSAAEFFSKRSASALLAPRAKTSAGSWTTPQTVPRTSETNSKTSRGL